MTHFIDTYDIGTQLVRIAAVTFGEKVITDSAFGFNRHKQKSEVLDALSAMKFRPELGGGTNTAMAIANVRQKFFVNARPNAINVAIVLTDGRSKNPRMTALEAGRLKSKGVKMIAIGVGRSVDDTELRSIASNAKNVFKVDTYGALEHILRSLDFVTCRGK